MSGIAKPRWLIESVLLVVVYCITAYVVVQVQAGIGSPNLLWLPAGIALAAILLRGPAALAPIFLATLGFHFYSLFSAQSSSLQAWAATLISAVGSTAQAWFTAWLLQRWIHHLQITTVADAGRFVLSTAIGALIGASTGALALYSQGRIGTESLSLTWLTWWVGDLSGMLVVAPLALVYRHWKSGKREWSLLSLPIIGLGCSFTLVTAFIVKHLDHDARVQEFMNSGVAMGQALQRTLELSQRDLMATHALFYNVEVSHTEFRNFSAGLLAQNNLIRSLNWAPRVSQAQRSAFEAEARTKGIANYQIHDRLPDGKRQPAAESTEYLPILLSEPEALGAPVLGYNLLSDPDRRDALALARFTGEPRASRLVELERGGKAVVIYWPVYRNEYKYDGPARDSDNLRGFVTLALQVERLAEETLRPFEGPGIEVWLFDVTEAKRTQLLHHFGTNTLKPDTPPDIEQLRQGIYQETGHRVAGREWILISHPTALGNTLKANGQFLGILFGGFGFTFMLAMYMIGRQRSEHALHERDERLMSQNAVLTQLARYGLTPESNLDQQLQEVLAASAITLKVERVSLWLLEESGQRLHCQHLFTSSSGRFSSGLELNAADAPKYFATLSEGRGFAANDAQTDPRTSEFSDSYLRPLNITAMMDVPVRVGGKTIGVVCHEHVGSPRVWAADEQSFAASLGDLASLVIESAKRDHAEKALQESYQALELKVAERTEELRSANERLRQLDQLKSMFIASMSHELRTPLNSIIGFTGVVLQEISGPLSDKQKDHLGRVYGSARHLLALITDVIDISKIEAGYAEVYAEDFPLNQLIEEAIATLQPQRLEKGLELEFQAPKEINIRSDRKRLLQCVLNLLSNAVKYSEQGLIQIRLIDQVSRIVIEIEDTGIGIAPEALGKLFQPFERIDTHLRIKTPGTGLGLYLTRKIVADLLQGDVSASSTVGKGSTFTLWIPHALRPMQHPPEMSEK